MTPEQLETILKNIITALKAANKHDFKGFEIEGSAQLFIDHVNLNKFLKEKMPILFPQPKDDIKSPQM